MDYSTIAYFKESIHSKTDTTGSGFDNALIARCISEASRSWDRVCSGSIENDSADYFFSGSISGERLEGRIDAEGMLICYPHKPIITSVSAMTFQKSVIDQTYTIDVARIEASGPKVMAYPNNIPFPYPDKCRVNISYVGGLGASLADLPADLVEAVTILAIRFYREAETGLKDQMGIAEMGDNVYTKAWPERVKATAERYTRKVGWRYIS